MKRFRTKMSLAANLVQHGDFATIQSNLRRKIRSSDASLGLRRDMAVAFRAPEASYPIHVRPARPNDMHLLLDPNELGFPGLSDGSERSE